MKTAIYIEDGTIQLVITPENDFEKNALRSFEKEPLDVKIHTGSFYDCRGGWVRQTNYHHSLHGVGTQDDRSLILTMKQDFPKAG